MERFSRFKDWLKGIEWSWSLVIQVATLVASFTVPAWAFWATQLLSDYAPFSWVAAGFAGLLIGAVVYALYQWGYRKRIHAKYDARFLERSDWINPLGRTFENNRIVLNDFVLPSHPIVEDKTFVDCEIIGPANIYMAQGSQAVENKYPRLDAVYVEKDKQFENGFVFVRCLFTNCSFHRVTLFVDDASYETHRDHDLLNWITLTPTDQRNLLRLLEAPDETSSEVGAAALEEPDKNDA